MKSKVGIDLVYIPRYLDLVDNQDFLQKILTINEQELFHSFDHPQRKLEFLCGRYALKEAYAKALKLGIGKIDFLDFEVLKDESGAPMCNHNNVEVSLSHDGDYVIAIVMVGDSDEF